MSTIPTKKDFIHAIEQLKIESRLAGDHYVDVQSADLHKKLGHYPGPNHRMATCCDAMYDVMDASKGDEIIESPRKGKGANLKIRYIHSQ